MWMSYSSGSLCKVQLTFQLMRIILLTGEFAENGSFIGQYGQSKMPTPLTATAVATIV